MSDVWFDAVSSRDRLFFLKQAFYHRLWTVMHRRQDEPMIFQVNTTWTRTCTDEYVHIAKNYLMPPPNNLRSHRLARGTG